MMELRDEYFEWMYQKICGKNYRDLLSTLNNIEFTYLNVMDENRLKDGLDLRGQFASECKIPHVAIKLKMDMNVCSVLEVMVALAIRMETNIMSDSEYGDRTPLWFWNMVESLGLDDMDDMSFDYDEVERVIDTFLNRQYEYDGKGGLFYVPDAEYDMRDMEIWYQMCAYSNTLLDL